MKLLLDSFWRAAAYCLHPRVIALSVLPLLLMAGLAFGVGYFFWEPAVSGVREALQSWQLVATFIGWLEGLGLSNLKSVLAPLIVVFVSTPVIVVLSLLMVAALMTPSILSLVGERRFALMDRKRGGSFLGSLFGALWATLVALVALLVSIPLWFVPPLVLIVPPLIWGWLTYRVFAFDVLADHASREERLALISERRWPLLAMGIVAGYMGAAPALLWAMGMLTVVFAPVLVFASIWLYTLVFAFSALWFANYLLAALAARRDRSSRAEAGATPTPQSA